MTRVHVPRQVHKKQKDFLEPVVQFLVQVTTPARRPGTPAVWRLRQLSTCWLSTDLLAVRSTDSPSLHRWACRR